MLLVVTRPVISSLQRRPLCALCAMVSDTEPDLVTQIETLYEQDFYSLRDECLHNNFLFEDPEFLPRDEFLRERTKQYEDIVWLRPHDICRPEDPILVSNKNEGFDVKQVDRLVDFGKELQSNISLYSAGSRLLVRARLQCHSRQHRPAEPCDTTRPRLHQT